MTGTGASAQGSEHSHSSDSGAVMATGNGAASSVYLRSPDAAPGHSAEMPLAHLLSVGPGPSPAPSSPSPLCDTVSAPAPAPAHSITSAAHRQFSAPSPSASPSLSPSASSATATTTASASAVGAQAQSPPLAYRTSASARPPLEPSRSTEQLLESVFRTNFRLAKDIDTLNDEWRRRKQQV